MGGQEGSSNDGAGLRERDRAGSFGGTTAGLGAPRTIGAVLRARAEASPRQVAIVGTDFAPISYAKLQDQIDAARRTLRDAGYGAEARIAVAIAANAQAALALIAVSCSASSIPIDPKLTVDEVERAFMILRPNAVVVLRGRESAARTAAENRGFAIIEATFAPDLALHAPKAASPAPEGEPDPDAPAFILHTSGTIAGPKLVPFSHANLLAVVERQIEWFALTPQDRCLSVAPVYYSHALTTTVFPPLLTGGSAAYPSNPSIVDFDEWFVALGPTWSSAGPTLHLAIVEAAEARGDARARHNLRFITSAGAPMTRDTHGRMEAAFGVPVVEHYGSSETAHVASNRPPPGRAKFGTVGQPWPGVVKIVDENGREAPIGERGEVLIGGPSVMAGYLNAAAADASVFVEGWYRTGDVGSLDEEGFLTLHGREKELINRGGEKVSPVEVDQALMSHPAVAQAAAFGVPHPRLGEDVAAAVVLRPGAVATPAELRDHVAGRLASFKTPRRITILDDLPKGITGKVRRSALSEQLREGAQAANAPQQAAMRDTLLRLWRKLLKTDAIGLDDDFFEKGGDSMLAMSLSLELQKIVGRELSESLLFDAPTIRALEEALADEMKNPAG